MALADEGLGQAERDRDEARAEVYTLRSRLAEVTAALRAREQVSAVPIPDTLDDLPAWACVYMKDCVELLPRAFAAAKKSLYENPALAYEALLLLRDSYVPMRRSGAPGGKERWESGLRQLGLECSRTHSGTRAGENPDDYFVTHGGRRREVDMHLKGSNSRDPRYCFRLYFFWCEEQGRVVVASLPSHLDTRVT